MVQVRQSSAVALRRIGWGGGSRKEGKDREKGGEGKQMGRERPKASLGSTTGVMIL